MGNVRRFVLRETFEPSLAFVGKSIVYTIDETFKSCLIFVGRAKVFSWRDC